MSHRNGVGDYSCSSWMLAEIGPVGCAFWALPPTLSLGRETKTENYYYYQ